MNTAAASLGSGTVVRQDGEDFAIDWGQKRARCPRGRLSIGWKEQPFEGVQSCVRAQSYAGCERIGSWCRLRKLGCSGIYVEYDRFGVLVNDDSLLLAALRHESSGRDMNMKIDSRYYRDSYLIIDFRKQFTS